MEEQTKQRLRHSRDATEVNKRHADMVRERKVNLVMSERVCRLKEKRWRIGILTIANIGSG